MKKEIREVVLVDFCLHSRHRTWWALGREWVSAYARERKKCWLFRRSHLMCQVIKKKTSQVNEQTIFGGKLVLAQLLSWSSSTSIQRVDDCELFVCWRDAFSAFISSILTEHFFFVPQNEAIFIVMYVACVYGVAVVGICWANNLWKYPAMRCIASDRFVEIMRPRGKRQTFFAMTKQFSIVQIVAVLPFARHSRTRYCTCRSPWTSICPFKRSIYICLFHN